MALAAVSQKAEATLDIGELFDAHAARLGGFIRRRTSEGPHVDDILQETFLIAHRQRHTFRGESTPKTWLYGIANHVCRHHLRSKGRFVAMLGRLLRSEPPAEASVLARWEPNNVAQIRSVLASLSEPLREVFVLYELEELSGEEIAAMLEIPAGTVWSRLASAREQVKRAVRRGTQQGGTP